MEKEEARKERSRDASRRVQDELARFGCVFQVFEGGPEEAKMLAELKAREEAYGPCTEEKRKQ